jgi:hypothetical protein
MKNLSVPLLVLLGFFIVCADQVAAEPDPRIVSVSCPEASISEALDVEAEELVVEISGTCEEYVLVTRSNVTLRGVGEQPTIVGVATRYSVIGVEKATGVRIEGLTIERGRGNGVMVADSMNVSLSDLTVQDNASNGIQANRSSVNIGDVVVRRNGLAGIAARCSDMTLSGVIDISFCGTHGIRLERSSRLDAVANVISNHNFVGLVLTANSSAHFSFLQTNHNDLLGVYLTRNSHLSVLSHLEMFRNGSFGLYAWIDSHIDVLSMHCTENGEYGVYLNGSYGDLSNALITGHTEVDLLLQFGSKFCARGRNEINTVVCDGTVLTRGDACCPEGKSAAIKKHPVVSVIPRLVENQGPAPDLRIRP